MSTKVAASPKRILALCVSAIGLFVCGCAGIGRPAVLRPVDVAVNLGFERDREVDVIRREFQSWGIPHEQRAMSCNEAPLVVNREDFLIAKSIATEAVIKNSLTVRLYKTPVGFQSEMEVWEQGKKTREEPHKLYNISEETIRILRVSHVKNKDWAQ